MADTNEEIGRKVRELRKRAGMGQRELSEVAGLSIGVVRNIEQGVGARIESLHAVARVLGVDTGYLFPRSTGAPDPVETDESRDLVLADLRGALLPPVGWDGPVYRDGAEARPDLVGLRRATRALVDAYHGNKYDKVGQLAAGLIRSAHFHLESLPEEQRRAVHHLRADILQIVGRYLNQVGERELAMLALRDAVADAKRSDDRPLASCIMSSQAWALTVQARFEEAEAYSARAADEVEPRLSKATPDQLGAWGWLLGAASAAAARNNRQEAARDYLAASQAAGARLQREHDDLTGHSSFGPLTAALKGVENALIAGKPDTALLLADQLPRLGDVKTLDPARWQRHLLDRAHATILTGESEKATDLLDDLRRKAPEWLRHQRLAKDVTRLVVESRKRTLTKRQQQLVKFLDVRP